MISLLCCLAKDGWRAWRNAPSQMPYYRETYVDYRAKAIAIKRPRAQQPIQWSVEKIFITLKMLTWAKNRPPISYFDHVMQFRCFIRQRWPKCGPQATRSSFSLVELMFAFVFCFTIIDTVQRIKVFLFLKL